MEKRTGQVNAVLHPVTGEKKTPDDPESCFRIGGILPKGSLAKPNVIVRENPRPTVLRSVMYFDLPETCSGGGIRTLDLRIMIPTL